jgi:CheY-like chemotaxis protein
MQRIFERYELFQDTSHSLDGRIIIEFLITNRFKPENLPDLIFLDLNMPGFSGWDFLEEFERLQSSFRKAINIYIVSSSIDPNDKLNASQYHFVKGFLTKPVKKERLEMIYAGYLSSGRKTG